ncbi:MAG: hypothetical protein GY853_09780 [PVC group bacterium]|nr:hypothetical protein [PVC group bacterium]
MDFSYEGILAEIKEQLALETDWANTFYFGVYDNILSPVSYIANQMVYAAEFYYRESNWETAQKIESLMVKSDYLDYTAYRKVGASGDILVSADSGFSDSYVYTGNNVNISRWDEFTNENGNLNVYATEDYVYATGETGNLEVDVKQGTPKSFTYTALGSTNEKIYIYSDSVDNTEITAQIVDVDGNVLNEISICGTIVNEVEVPKRMYFLEDPTNYYCEVSNANDFSYVQLTFGNGVNTRKLAQGEYILIRYGETLGVEGNIQNSDIITAFKNQPKDVYDNDVTLYVNNTEEISDASNIEDIEHIRNHAPNIFQTGYRCGGSNDWVAVLEDHPDIANAIVWSAYDVSDFSEENINKVYIAAISADGNDLNTTQKEDIIVNYLKNKKSPTEIASFQDLEIIYAKFVVDGRISTGKTTVVDQDIKTVLDDNYGILNTDFATNIYESGFYDVINGVSDLTWHNTEIYTLEKDFPYSTSSTVIAVSKMSNIESGLVDQIYLSPDSFEIWVENLVSGKVQTIKRAGYDASGVILPDNDYVLSNTGISYANNTFQFVIDTLASGVTADDYNINISYKTCDGNGDQKNNMRLSTFKQITDVDSNYVDTTLIYS